MRVNVLCLDGVFDSGLAVVLDTLETANALAAGMKTRWDVSVVGLRKNVSSHHGLKVPVVAVAEGAPRPDVVVVPAIGHKTIDTISAALARPDIAEACEVLRGWSKAGARITGACTATFILASAGLLDGGRATTTWWLSPLFRERFPAVELDESQMIVESGKVTTAGAALAHVDLGLWLVRQKSPSLARSVARYLVFDARPSQAAYVMPDHLAHADPVVEKFERWARNHLAGFSMPAAAKACAASERTLERRIRAVLGKSPLSFVQDLRVEHALHRLQTSDESVDEIAAAVGYEDGATLRVLLRKKTGRGVRELRAI